MGVMAGQQELVIGGGVESMSRVPMGSDGGGLDGHNPHLRELHPLVPQGISADLIATLEGFTRARARPLRRRRASARCAVAQKEGRFAKSLVPVRDRDGKVVLDRDEYPRAGTTAESLGKLAAVLRGAGRLRAEGRRRARSTSARCRATRRSRRSSTSTTPGNSSGIVDGAARRAGRVAATYAQGARPEAARALRRDGDRGRRAGHHADRADAGHAALPREGAA